jgi:hypothetical protein
VITGENADKSTASLTVTVTGNIMADSVIENGVLVKYNGESRKVTIPSFVTAIGEDAFRGHDEIEELTISGSVKRVENISSLEGLEKVTFEEGVTSIGDYAFSDCNYLNRVTFPDSLTSIGAHAFENTDLGV